MFALWFFSVVDIYSYTSFYETIKPYTRLFFSTYFPLKGFEMFLRKPNILKIILLQIVLISAVSTGYAQNNTGFSDFNIYYDSRDFSVFTLNLLAKLPNRFQYFSLTNYEGAHNASDLSKFYSEQNIRWKLSDKSPFDATLQYAMRGGDANDDLKFGVRWRISNTPKLDSVFKKVNMFYSVNPMFVQLRYSNPLKYMTMIEHVYKIDILKNKLDKRIYLAGFADQVFVNTDGEISFEWVTEHQLGVRLVDQLYAVAEFRINTFLPDNNVRMGYGLQYKIIF